VSGKRTRARFLSNDGEPYCSNLSRVPYKAVQQAAGIARARVEAEQYVWMKQARSLSIL